MSIVFLDGIVQSQKQGEARGMVSICSAHPEVLRAAMRCAVSRASPVLIESTCNQVNQFGGYTGMRPLDFAVFVTNLARENHLPLERVLLGGDHLGPSVWQDEPAEAAMQKAEQMVQAYVRAGYVKIHLDASMRLGDDDTDQPLDVELSARRSARLAIAAEQAFGNLPEGSRSSSGLRYVIGTEVPSPGGVQAREGALRVSTVAEVKRTVEATRTAFQEAKVEVAWEHTMAVVVQPGVEFGDDFVYHYQPELARELVRYSEDIPLVYEAHSTDYQTRQALRQLVQDHFAILKVGPALTFAYRQAVYALAALENELFPAAQRSNLVEVMDEAMIRDPRYWEKYYTGSPAEQASARRDSLSDRVRYYWVDPGVQTALGTLLQNLGESSLPQELLEQHLPRQGEQIREGRLESSPGEIVLDRIAEVLEDYHYACGD